MVLMGSLYKANGSQMVNARDMLHHTTVHSVLAISISDAGHHSPHNVYHTNNIYI